MDKSKSYIMLILSMLIFGTIGVFRRYIPLSSGLLACLRGILGAVFLGIFVLLGKRRVFRNITLKRVGILAVTGALIGLNWMLLFEAFNRTTVPVATLCYYTEPTIVILLSTLFFKEKLNVKKIVCVLFSIVGMIFVSGVVGNAYEGPQNKEGILMGLGAAVLYSSVVLINKKVAHEDAYEKTIIQLLAAALVLVPYLFLTEDFTSISLTGTSVVLVVIVGIIHTGIAYALYFGSMNMLPAQTIAVTSYLDPVSALVFAAVFLGEKMSVFGVIGAILIIGSSLTSEIDTRQILRKIIHSGILLLR